MEQRNGGPKIGKRSICVENLDIKDRKLNDNVLTLSFSFLSLVSKILAYFKLTVYVMFSKIMDKRD